MVLQHGNAVTKAQLTKSFRWGRLSFPTIFFSMTKSYDSSLTADKDKVRFLSGDTGATEDDMTLEDEEIEWVISTEANVWRVAAECIDNIIQKEQKDGLEELEVGETRVRYKKLEDLRLKSDRLRTRGSSHMFPSAGGVYQADSDALNENTAVRQPAIRIDMDTPESIAHTKAT